MLRLLCLLYDGRLMHSTYVVILNSLPGAVPNLFFEQFKQRQDTQAWPLGQMVDHTIGIALSVTPFQVNCDPGSSCPLAMLSFSQEENWGFMTSQDLMRIVTCPLELPAGPLFSGREMGIRSVLSPFVMGTDPKGYLLLGYFGGSDP